MESYQYIREAGKGEKNTLMLKMLLCRFLLCAMCTCPHTSLFCSSVTSRLACFNISNPLLLLCFDLWKHTNTPNSLQFPRISNCECFHTSKSCTKVGPRFMFCHKHLFWWASFSWQRSKGDTMTRWRWCFLLSLFEWMSSHILFLIFSENTSEHLRFHDW